MNCIDYFLGSSFFAVKSKQQLRKAYDHINHPIFVLDVLLDGGFKFLLLNQTYEESVGLTTEDVTGKHPQECLQVDLAIQLEANYQRCVDSRSTIRYNEYVFGRYWNTTLVPELDDGRVCRIIIIGTAIEITKEIGIERLLRPAIERRELELHYQPIKQLSDGVTRL